VDFSATISVFETNLKMSRVPVTCISHSPHKIPHISLKPCSAIVGKFRAFVRGFPSGGVRGGLRCCVLDGIDFSIRLGGRGIRGTSKTQSQYEKIA
jgi:hypothetical protein